MYFFIYLKHTVPSYLNVRSIIYRFGMKTKLVYDFELFFRLISEQNNYIAALISLLCPTLVEVRKINTISWWQGHPILQGS